MTTAEDHEVGARAGRPVPDPALVHSVREFVSYLRLLKVWAGDPSFVELRRRCGIPTSTLADAVSPSRPQLPRLETVRAFVLACGAQADLVRWELAWRVVQSRQLPALAPPPAAGLESSERGDRPGREGRWVESGPGVPSARIIEGYALSRLPGPPRQLPRPAEHFVGRREALDQLDRPPEARQWAPVVAIVGGAGVGKSALALRWAHQQADSYPDGQLYVDLRDAAALPASSGAGTPRIRPARGNRAAMDGAPVSSAYHALLPLLAALGVPETEVPDGYAARVGLYRSLTRARRLLVMLDGAPDAGQVRALLPAGPSCVAVVTSRDRLSGLVARDGAWRLALAPLPPEAAERLIGLLVGPERTAREPAATAQLCRLCGYLPLALRIAAARIADAPQWPIAGYVNRLATNPIAALEVPGDESMSMRAALERSARRLTGPARCLLHRLALAPGRQFSTGDAAALIGLPMLEASCLVDLLAAGHLVEPAGPDRYTMPELVGRYAEALLGPAPPAGPVVPPPALAAAAN